MSGNFSGLGRELIRAKNPGSTVVVSRLGGATTDLRKEMRDVTRTASNNLAVSCWMPRQAENFALEAEWSLTRSREKNS